MISKTVNVHLTQEPSAGLFRVTRFTNTIQLSVGMIVPVAKVEEWCAMPKVNVYVDGMTPGEDKQILLEDSNDKPTKPKQLA